MFLRHICLRARAGDGMLRLMWCSNTSCRRDRDGNLQNVYQHQGFTANAPSDLPVICKNFPVSRRPFAAMLLLSSLATEPCLDPAPGADSDGPGGAAVELPQRSSPHNSASRRNMAKRDQAEIGDRDFRNVNRKVEASAKPRLCISRFFGTP